MWRARIFRNGVDYEDAILQANYEILLYDGTMNVDLNRDLVKTLAGSTCTYSDGQCTDYIYGDIFWNDDTCQNSISSVTIEFVTTR